MEGDLYKIKIIFNMLDIIVMTTYLDREKEGQQLDIDDYHGQCVLI